MFCIHCGAGGPNVRTGARRGISARLILAAVAIIVATLVILVLLTDNPIGTGMGGLFGPDTPAVAGARGPSVDVDTSAVLPVVATTTATATVTTPQPGADPMATKTPSPTPAPPTLTPTLLPTVPAPITGGDVILFVRVVGDSDGDGSLDWNGNRVICRVDSDGGDVRCLTGTDHSSSAPNWSPDGQHIVYASTRDGDPEIFVMNPDGSGQRQLTHNTVTDHGPNWSPDGEWIVFHRQLSGGAVELFRMRPDGTDVTQITANGRENRYPDWSVDGLIAFESGTNDPIDLDIYLTDAGGTFERRLTTGGYSVGANWSADGRYLAYSTGSPLSAQLAVWDRETDETVTVTADHDTEPSWSPDGRQIAYARWEPRLPQIWVVNLASGGSRQLVAIDGYMDTQPAWSP